MSAAVISLSPRAVVLMLDGDGPYNFSVPDNVSVGAAVVGWVSPDGAFKIVPVTIVPPASFDPITQGIEDGVPAVADDASGVTITQTTVALTSDQVQSNIIATAAAAYDARIAGGLAITSVNCPLANGTYGMTVGDRANIGGILSGYKLLNRLPKAGSTFLYPTLDNPVTGNFGVFDGPTFEAFAIAVEDAVYDAEQGSYTTDTVALA